MKIEIIILGLMILVGCGYQEDKGKEYNANPSVQEVQKEDGKVEIRTLDQKEANANMESNPEIILLDVRTEEEYKEIHIPKSMLIPLDQITENVIQTKIPDKNAIIYIYCRSGNRSKTAYEILYKMGYHNVYDIGGIKTWPYETEK